MLRILIILFFFFLVSCKQNKDEIVIVNPPLFNTAFVDNYLETNKEGYSYRTEVAEIGKLKLPSGKLIICEPLYIYDQKAIDFNISEGEYPVYLSQALVIKDDKIIDKRNALAKIKLSNNKAVKWEFIGAFGADGGTAGYLDQEVKDNIVISNNSESFMNRILSRFEESEIIKKPFEHNYHLYKQYIDLPFGSGNVIAFSSGWGDGRYNSYLGYDDQDNPVEILTDLGVLAWDQEKYVVAQLINQQSK